jgi:hypothetical protein
MHTQSYKKPSKTDDKPDAETVLFLYVTVTTACNQNCTVFEDISCQQHREKYTLDFKYTMKGGY